MGWSLELYTARADQVTERELSVRLIDIAPLLQVATLPPTGDSSLDKLSIVDSDGRRQAVVSCADYASERQVDAKLSRILESEISEVGADEGGADEEYADQLVELLQHATKHYTVSGTHDNSPSQRQVVVRVAYALSQIAGGLLHDLQSGDWMDADLFESLLDAYGAYAAL